MGDLSATPTSPMHHLWPMVERYGVDIGPLPELMLLTIAAMPFGYEAELQPLTSTASPTGRHPTDPEQYRDRLVSAWGPILHSLLGASLGEVMEDCSWLGGNNFHCQWAPATEVR